MKIAALLYEYEQGNILVTLIAYHTSVPSSIKELRPSELPSDIQIKEAFPAASRRFIELMKSMDDT
jgi:hypothetical protein